METNRGKSRASSAIFSDLLFGRPMASRSHSCEAYIATRSMGSSHRLKFWTSRALNGRYSCLERGLDRRLHGLTTTFVYVLDELPPNQNDSNVWSVRIDPHTGKPLGT